MPTPIGIESESEDEEVVGNPILTSGDPAPTLLPPVPQPKAPPRGSLTHLLHRCNREATPPPLATSGYQGVGNPYVIRTHWIHGHNIQRRARSPPRTPRTPSPPRTPPPPSAGQPPAGSDIQAKQPPPPPAVHSGGDVPAPYHQRPLSSVFHGVANPPAADRTPSSVFPGVANPPAADTTTPSIADFNILQFTPSMGGR